MTRMPVTRTTATRSLRNAAAPRRSLFQASASVRFAIATSLSGLLWAAIAWALR